MLKSAIEKELKSESNLQIWSSLINTVGNSFSDNWRSSEYTDYIRSNSKAQHFWFTGRKPTVMFIRTFILVWSKRTVTECIPSSTTTTVRGKRKKATSAEARRHNTTEMTTYSFLQHRNITSTLQAWTTCKCHFILSTSEIKRDSSHRKSLQITTKVSWVHISRFTSLTFFGAAAFGHYMGSMQPVHSLDLSEER